MIRIELPALMDRLNDFSRHALEAAASLCISRRSSEITVAHLLYQLADNPYADLRAILRLAGVDAQAFKQVLAEQFEPQAVGTEQYPAFSPLLIEMLQEAWLLGSLELQQPQLRSGLILLAVLLTPARYLSLAAVRLLEPLNRESLRKQFTALLADSVESPSAQPAAANVNDSAASALAKYGNDFTAAAEQGRVDPVLGRDEEIDLMIDILSRRRKNNPIVVGDAGVGKSAVVEGLALRIVQGRVPEGLREVRLWGLDLGALQAGAAVKGEFEKRLKTILDEVKASPLPIVLFIDEAHTLIGAGNAAGGSDAANLLKPALARGELRTIAATTWSEYKKYFEKDPALTRRFQLIKLDEPSAEQAVHMLRGLRQIYEHAHGVHISDAALHAAAHLSARYVSGRQLPDKAIDVLDTACARVATALTAEPRRIAALDNQILQWQAEHDLLSRDAALGLSIDVQRLAAIADSRRQQEMERDLLMSRWQEQKALIEQIQAQRRSESASTPDDVASEGTACEGRTDAGNSISTLLTQLQHAQRDGALLHADVGAEQIAQVIADWTGIPAGNIGRDQFQRLAALPQDLKDSIKGQDAALDHIHRHLLTATADLRRPGTPMGAFLLVGPSGVGKTETALRIADRLFGGKQFLTVINLSEYQEKHSVSRLLGAPPGYVGYGEGGVLTEAIRRQPYSVVLLDEVEKAHPEVLNLFYQAFDKGELNDGEGRAIDCRNCLFFLTSNIGFDDPAQALAVRDEASLRTALSRFFKPALLARMQVVQFQPLDEDVLAQIVDLRLQRLQAQFQSRYRAALHIDDRVRERLRARCVRHANGARMLDAAIDGELLPPLSLVVLQRMAAGEGFSHATLDHHDTHYIAELA